jgi:hypothetical protein
MYKRVKYIVTSEGLYGSNVVEQNTRWNRGNKSG